MRSHSGHLAGAKGAGQFLSEAARQLVDQKRAAALEVREAKRRKAEHSRLAQLELIRAKREAALLKREHLQRESKARRLGSLGMALFHGTVSTTVDGDVTEKNVSARDMRPCAIERPKATVPTRPPEHRQADQANGESTAKRPRATYEDEENEDVPDWFALTEYGNPGEPAHRQVLSMPPACPVPRIRLN